MIAGRFGQAAAESGAAGFLNECPGEKFCERLQGCAGNNLEERYEEARPGCPHECQRLRILEDSGKDETEKKMLAAYIEEMADRAAAGEQLFKPDYEIWEWELFIYWRKIERSFERSIWIKLGLQVDSFFKK